MDKKVQRVGKEALPYLGSIEAYEREFFLRLADFHAMEIASGPFKGRSPMQIYHEHLDTGWRPVRVNRLALDCAFAKRVGERKIVQGAISIGADRFRHPELAAFTGRRVEIVKPYRRGAWPLANLPDYGWVKAEVERLKREQNNQALLDELAAHPMAGTFDVPTLAHNILLYRFDNDTFPASFRRRAAVIKWSMEGVPVGEMAERLGLSYDYVVRLRRQLGLVKPRRQA